MKNNDTARPLLLEIPTPAGVVARPMTFHKREILGVVEKFFARRGKAIQWLDLQIGRQHLRSTI